MLRQNFLSSLLLFLLGGGLLNPSLGFCEWYIAGQGGFTRPNNSSDIKTMGVLEGVSLQGGTINAQNGVALHDSAMGGAKIGYFFESQPWVGIETEAYFTGPHRKQQPLTLSLGGATTPVNLPGSRIQVTTWAINMILRYPGTVWQPYGGAGLGIFFARTSTSTEEGGTDIFVPGVNVLAGLRIFITQNIALFTEYKYNHARFEFSDVFDKGAGLKADYSAHIFAGGVSFHFNGKQ